MYVGSFEWDDQNLEHIGRHGVRDHEVEEVILFDKPLYLRGSGDKYYAYGITEEGRYLFTVFVYKSGGAIRVITARDMSRKEKAYYKNRR